MTTQYVKVYYGPCSSFHTSDHKPQKLRALVDRLRKMGFRVDLVPVEFVNYCMIEMCGHEVFRCNISNLRFNTPYNRDPVCRRAVAAVLAAAVKFRRARNYLWAWMVIEEQMFKRSEYAPKERWPFDVDIRPFASTVDCLDCCGILVRKTSEVALH